MSNVQLRKALGMVTPVERLVVRNALKRCSPEFFQFSMVRFKGLFRVSLVLHWFTHIRVHTPVLAGRMYISRSSSDRLLKSEVPECISDPRFIGRNTLGGKCLQCEGHGHHQLLGCEARRWGKKQNRRRISAIFPPRRLRAQPLHHTVPSLIPYLWYLSYLLWLSPQAEWQNDTVAAPGRKSLPWCPRFRRVVTELYTAVFSRLGYYEVSISFWQILWSVSFTSTRTQEPKVDRAGGAFQAGVSVIAVVGLECKRESREFKMNIKKGPETLLAGEMMTGNWWTLSLLFCKVFQKISPARPEEPTWWQSRTCKLTIARNMEGGTS